MELSELDRSIQSWIVDAHCLLFVRHKARPLVNSDGFWVIIIATVYPNPLRMFAPSFVQSPVEQVAAESATDKLWNQSKIGDLNLVGDTSVELDITGGYAVHVQYIHLYPCIVDDGTQRAVI